MIESKKDNVAQEENKGIIMEHIEIKKVITKNITMINPLTIQYKSYPDIIPNLFVTSIVVKNHTNNFDYVDKTLINNEDEKDINNSTEIGMPITIEDIQYNIKNTIISELDSDKTISKLMDLLKNNSEDFFDTEAIYGVIVF